MPKFDVTAYAIVRVKIENIEAADHLEAMLKADKIPSYSELFDRDLVPGGSSNPEDGEKVVYTAFGEEFDGYLVDEHNDPELEKSIAYDRDYQPAHRDIDKADAKANAATPDDDHPAVEDLAREMYLYDDPSGHWHLEREDEKEAYRAYARIALRRSTVVTVHKSQGVAPADIGAGQVCYYCGHKIDPLAGNPGKWGLCFTQPDHTGKPHWHHVACVQKRLEPSFVITDDIVEFGLEAMVKAALQQPLPSSVKQYQEHVVRSGIASTLPLLLKGERETLLEFAKYLAAEASLRPIPAYEREEHVDRFLKRRAAASKATHDSTKTEN